MHKNLDNEVDDRWRRKGGAHKLVDKRPRVCPNCGGAGEISSNSHWEECKHCEGLGEIYDD